MAEAIIVRASIDDIVFDVCEQETHDAQAEVTQHPVEDGSVIADHVIQKPDTLSLQLVVTNSPLGTQATAVDGQRTRIDPERAARVHADLLGLKLSGVSLPVLTSLRQYTDMLITKVSAVRSGAQDGQILRVNVSLIEIRTAVSESVSRPVTSTPGRDTKKESGRKPTVAASDAVAEKASAAIDAHRTAANSGFAAVGFQ